MRHAVLFGAGFACIKTGCVDYFVQTVVEGTAHEDVSGRRVLTFALFGLAYLGCVQYFLYVPVYTRLLFPSAAKFVAQPLRQRLRDWRGMGIAVLQVVLDMAVHMPFIYYPCFYLTKEFVMTDGKAGWAGRAAHNWRTNFFEDIVAGNGFWGPANVFNFIFCPLWGRVPFLAMMSLVWSVVLSRMRGAHQPIDDDEVVELKQELRQELADALPVFPDVSSRTPQVTAVPTRTVTG